MLTGAGDVIMRSLINFESASKMGFKTCHRFGDE